MPKLLSDNGKFRLAIHSNLNYPGGDPFVLSGLTKGLSSRGFDITLMGLLEKRMIPFTHSLHWIRRLIPLRGERSVKQMVRGFAETPPDAIMISGGVSLGILSALLLGKPIFWRVISHPKWWLGLRGAPYRKVKQVVATIGLFSQKVITVSNFIRSSIVQEGFRHVETIYEGCDTKYFSPNAKERLEFRREFGLTSHDVAVGVLANMDWQKRHDIVIRALALLRKQNIHLKCFFVGGAFRKAMRLQEAFLKRLIQKLRLESQIIFTGFRYDRRRVMNGLDLLAFPFLDEAFGLSVLEGMSLGKTVLVNSSGALPEIVTHNQDGIVVEPENPAALAKALHDILGNPSKARVLGENARKKVIQKFSLDRQVLAYERLLKKNVPRNV